MSYISILARWRPVLLIQWDHFLSLMGMMADQNNGMPLFCISSSHCSGSLVEVGRLGLVSERERGKVQQIARNAHPSSLWPLRWFISISLLPFPLQVLSVRWIFTTLLPAVVYLTCNNAVKSTHLWQYVLKACSPPTFLAGFSKSLQK